METLYQQTDRLIRSMRGFEPAYDVRRDGRVDTLTFDYLQTRLKKTQDSLSRDVVYDNKELGKTHVIVWSTSAGASIHHKCDWQVIQDRLKAVTGQDEQDIETNPESAWWIERFNHYAIGYLEFIVLNLNTAPYSVLHTLIEAENHLDYHLSLDDELLDTMETDALTTYLIDEFNYSCYEAAWLSDATKAGLVNAFVSAYGDTKDPDYFKGEDEFIEFVDNYMDDTFPEVIYPLEPSEGNIEYDAAYIYPAPNQLPLF